MTCSQCGVNIPPASKFCPKCGMPLGAKCARCGAVIGENSQQCPACGAPSTGQMPPAERKLVTVLFCDLVGSTAIAERLDPEEYHGLLERYIELVLREIHRLGGLVNQLAGDGVMALFGAPVAREDAPERAVRAALAIRCALARLAGELKKDGTTELQVRIGIHTGPVMVGTIGNAIKMDYTATGDTTNLAARLQELAQPASILISEATHRLVRGIFQVRNAGKLPIKGKREAVNAYEVRGLAEATTPMAIAAARGLTPFVGRKGELAQLRACYERLANNLAQLVAVVGEAGSGKSRLLYEFKNTLSKEQIVSFESRCSSLSQAAPYGAVSNLLRCYFTISSDDDASAICDKVSARLDRLGPAAQRFQPFLCRLLCLPAAGPVNLSPAELKREMFEAVAGVVVAASIRSPVLMIIEDLQWIDDSSRELLELAMGRLATDRVMVIVSHRPDYDLAWKTKAAFTQLNLRPLSEEEALEMVRSVAGSSPPAGVEKLILARAEGNPFFTEEITRALVEEGHIAGSNTGLQPGRRPGQIRIPDTVQELIAARLDRFGQTTKRVAQVASVLGRQFRRGQLEKLLEQETADIPKELEELERRGLVHANQLIGDDEFRFGESLTQEVAYESLLIKERRRLHERVATMLEEEQTEPAAERLALVAHHYSRSANLGRALDALVRAAGEAERVPSYPTAAALYQEAWQAAGKLLKAGRRISEETKRQAVKAALGVCRMPVLYSWGSFAQAERAARIGRRLAREVDDVEALANLYSLQGMLIIMRSKREQFSHGLGLIEEGHATALRAGLKQAALSVSRGLAWNYVIDGRFSLAGRTIDWAVKELERLRHEEKQTELYLGARWLRDAINYHRDLLDEAASGAAATYEIAVKSSNRTVQSASAGTVAQTRFVRGKYGEARKWANQSLEVAQAIGLAGATQTAASIALICEVELGKTSAVPRYLSLLEQALAGEGDAGLNCSLVIEALLAAGELERANRLALRFSRAGGELRQTLATLAKGRVMFRLGPDHWPEARRCYTRAIAMAQGLGHRSSVAAAAVGAAGLAVATGQEASAREYINQATNIGRELGLGHYLKQADRLVSEMDRRSLAP